MIASISGVLVSKSPNLVVVDVHGVGYQIFIPLSTFYHLSEEGKPVRLQTYTHVREDALQLYGFLKAEEKSVFLLLLGVSGVGPKLALNILSGLPLEEFVKAVRADDAAKLALIPGVGKKTAERLALELKDKMRTVLHDTAQVGAGDAPLSQSPTTEDVVSALVNLGYKTPQAREAIRKVLASSDDDQPIEDLIKAALKVLSR